MDAGKKLDGPRVRIISETIQEFMGIRYYRSGKYFSNSAKKENRRIHTAVWVEYNGEVGDGFQVHHKDKDRTHNQIENLERLKTFRHQSGHGMEQRERAAEMGREHQHRTKEWHGSDAGKEWHKQQYERTKNNLRQTHEAACSECGKVFQAESSVKNSLVKFCSKACKAVYRRKSGVDDVDRVCAKCGATFSSNRYSPRGKCFTCSPLKKRGRLLSYRPRL